MLPEAFADEAFAFYGTVLTGTPKQRERWKRAVDATNDALGEAVGKLYVAKYFPPAEKARAEAMVKNLIAAFGRRDRQARLDGARDQGEGQGQARDAQGRRRLPRPVARLLRRSRSSRGDAFGNAERAELFEYRRNLAKLGQPVDRGEWVMTPQPVNAVNLPAMNAMNFPAAILQPPYFDPERPAAMDYGADRRDDRPRDQPQLRRPGRALRRERQAAQLVDQGGLRALPGVGRARSSRQYNAYKPFPDLARQRQADLEREHRRRRGARGRLRRLPDLARRQAGAGRRGPHRRPAVLPQLRAELAAQDPRAARCGSGS